MRLIRCKDLDMIENKASFFARLEPRLATSELTRIRGAYLMATVKALRSGEFGHRAQVRKELAADGNPLRYFEHVRRVAIVLMDEAQVHDPDLVCTALLHDTLEDTEDIDSGIIEQFFGTNVARRVRLLTKEPKEGYVERLAWADKETVLVKACDRLDNLRSLGGTTEEFRERQIKETVQHYLPVFRSVLLIGTRGRAILGHIERLLVELEDNPDLRGA